MQVTLPTAACVSGGGIITMPTLALTLKATGSVGTVGKVALTEYVNITGVNAPIIGAQTATFDGYPTTGSADSTPPKAAPVTLASTTIS